MGQVWHDSIKSLETCTLHGQPVLLRSVNLALRSDKRWARSLELLQRLHVAWADLWLLQLFLPVGNGIVPRPPNVKYEMLNNSQETVKIRHSEYWGCIGYDPLVYSSVGEAKANLYYPILKDVIGYFPILKDAIKVIGYVGCVKSPSRIA